MAKLDQQRNDAAGANAHAIALDQRFRRPLIAFFYRRVCTYAEAEDLAQEVFLRLLRQDVAVREETAHAYVFQIAANLLRDRGRRYLVRKGAHAENPEGDRLLNAGAMPAIEEITPERILCAKHDLHVALAALDELCERTREVFLLFRVEGMKQKEIAAALDISVSSVEKHVVKALVHLARRCVPA